MKPLLLSYGQTDSNFAPLINDKHYHKLSDWFIEKNGGERLVPIDASSRKLKTQTAMIGVIKKSLKENDLDAYTKFIEVMKSAKGLTQKKNSYYYCLHMTY